MTVKAVYENGVFRPTVPVELPEHCHVEFDPKITAAPGDEPQLDAVYAVLNARFESAETDVAERHDEHQP